eukprot:7384053-Prymnesium_polylepis.5
MDSRESCDTEAGRIRSGCMERSSCGMGARSSRHTNLGKPPDEKRRLATILLAQTVDETDEPLAKQRTSSSLGKRPTTHELVRETPLAAIARSEVPCVGVNQRIVLMPAAQQLEDELQLAHALVVRGGVLLPVGEEGVPVATHISLRRRAGARGAGSQTGCREAHVRPIQYK